MKSDIQPRKLTEANVRGLQPATARGYVVRDTELKGFIVIVNKKSSVFIVGCPTGSLAGTTRPSSPC